jgi:hypothetical protein
MRGHFALQAPPELAVHRACDLLAIGERERQTLDLHRRHEVCERWTHQDVERDLAGAHALEHVRPRPCDIHALRMHGDREAPARLRVHGAPQVFEKPLQVASRRL